MITNVADLVMDLRKENAPIRPSIVEFREIEVEPLRLIFIRGYKE